MIWAHVLASIAELAPPFVYRPDCRHDGPCGRGSDLVAAWYPASYQARHRA